MRNADVSTVWHRAKASVIDDLKNAARWVCVPPTLALTNMLSSMYRMASANAFPAIDLSRAGRMDKLFRWPYHIFRCRSTKSDAWIAGLRAQALDTYKNLNRAVST